MKHEFNRAIARQAEDWMQDCCRDLVQAGRDLELAINRMNVVEPLHEDGETAEALQNKVDQLKAARKLINQAIDGSTIAADFSEFGELVTPGISRRDAGAAEAVPA